MGLKDGNLKSLLLSPRFLPSPQSPSSALQQISDTVFHQMLQALDHLEANKVVHRDVKPENILYTQVSDDSYRFQLGDFGLCNNALCATSTVGTPIYMAPEMLQDGKHTHKVDVWSLYVTMLWALDVDGFRATCNNFTSHGQIQSAVLSIASKNTLVAQIRDMAISDPGNRASAAQMLDKCYNGEGLAHQQTLVSPPDKDPEVTAVQALPPGPSTLAA